MAQKSHLPRRLMAKKAGGKAKATEEVNPEYIQWSTMEQQVLGFLMLSMTKDVMVQVAGCYTPREVWTQLE
jgi:hypothetical protein